MHCKWAHENFETEFMYNVANILLVYAELKVMSYLYTHVYSNIIYTSKIYIWKSSKRLCTGKSNVLSTHNRNLCSLEEEMLTTCYNNDLNKFKSVIKGQILLDYMKYPE